MSLGCFEAGPTTFWCANTLIELCFQLSSKRFIIPWWAKAAFSFGKSSNLSTGRVKPEASTRSFHLKKVPFRVFITVEKLLQIASIRNIIELPLRPQIRGVAGCPRGIRVELAERFALSRVVLHQRSSRLRGQSRWRRVPWAKPVRYMWFESFCAAYSLAIIFYRPYFIGKPRETL